MSYKSWSPAPYSQGSSAYGHIQSDCWTGSPAPTPGAPHMNTVSLPHPNSTPHHPSSFCMLLFYRFMSFFLTFHIRRYVIWFRYATHPGIEPSPVLRRSSTCLLQRVTGYPAYPSITRLFSFFASSPCSKPPFNTATHPFSRISLLVC